MVKTGEGIPVPQEKNVRPNDNSIQHAVLNVLKCIKMKGKNHEQYP